MWMFAIERERRNAGLDEGTACHFFGDRKDVFVRKGVDAGQHELAPVRLHHERGRRRSGTAGVAVHDDAPVRLRTSTRTLRRLPTTMTGMGQAACASRRP